MASCPLHLIAFIILSPSEAAGRLWRLVRLRILCCAFTRRRGLHIHTNTLLQPRGNICVRIYASLLKLLLDHFNQRDLIPSGSAQLESAVEKLQMPLNIHTCTRSISGESWFWNANEKRLHVRRWSETVHGEWNFTYWQQKFFTSRVSRFLQGKRRCLSKASQRVSLGWPLHSLSQIYKQTNTGSCI